MGDRQIILLRVCPAAQLIEIEPRHGAREFFYRERTAVNFNMPLNSWSSRRDPFEQSLHMFFARSISRHQEYRLARHHLHAIVIAACLLYTSDAADDLLCVDLGGR